MASPITYSEWVSILERFGAGDDTIFEDINGGSFVLDAGTASRFYKKVDEVYKKRKQHWLEKFQRNFKIKSINSVDDFAIALREGKQNLTPLKKFVSSNGIPDDLRNTLQKDLSNFVLEVKNSLKDNITKDNNNREKIILIVNSSFLEEMSINEDSQKNQNNTCNTTFQINGRKIIF
jgi:hypothetical protein